MTRQRARGVMVLIGTAVCAATLTAHDTWLLPHRGYVPVGGRVTFDMTSGGAFARNETAILPARIAATGVRVGGNVRALDRHTVVGGALRFTATMPAAGAATAWVSLHPKVLTLRPALIEGYLREIGASPALRRTWNPTPGTSWRERYSKHAKTFVRVGSTPAADDGWRTPTGQPLELLPLQDPLTLRAGDSLTVRLLQCGTPLSGVAVGTQRAGAPHGPLVETNAAGEARVALPQAGRWLLRTTVLGTASDFAGARCDAAVAGDTVTVGYVSQFATITLDVAGRAP
jgi:hypothetical protein